MLAISYISLSALMIILVLLGVYQGAKKAKYSTTKSNKLLFQVAALFAVWLTYISFLQGSELLLDKSLPPKMLLLVVLPFTVFCVYFYNKNYRSSVVANVPLTWPVYVQSFRILVEIIILYTHKEGVMPKSATFEGLNFDIVMGILAIPVGLTLFRGGVRNSLFAKVWNIWGILMILFVAFIIVSSYLQPEALWESEMELVDPSFFAYPYILLAGVLAPLGIFFHVFSLTQLRQLKEEA